MKRYRVRVKATVNVYKDILVDVIDVMSLENAKMRAEKEAKEFLVDCKQSIKTKDLSTQFNMSYYTYNKPVEVEYDE